MRIRYWSSDVCSSDLTEVNVMAGRRADLVVLSGDDRRFLEAQVRRHKAPRSLSDRCRMVLLCAEGLQSKEVAERLGVHEHTVGKWRRRFVQAGIEGMTDEYRAGRPRTVSDTRSEEHTSELQSLMRISYAVFCLKKNNIT